MATATLFTVPQLAKLISTAHGRPVSESAIRRALSAGKAPWTRIGQARCVQADDVGLVEQALGLASTAEVSDASRG